MIWITSASTFTFHLFLASTSTASNLCVARTFMHSGWLCGRFAVEPYPVELPKSTKYPTMTLCHPILVLKTWRKWSAMTIIDHRSQIDGAQIWYVSYRRRNSKVKTEITLTLRILNHLPTAPRRNVENDSRMLASTGERTSAGIADKENAAETGGHSRRCENKSRQWGLCADRSQKHKFRIERNESGSTSTSCIII